MAKILIIAEHDGSALNPATAKCVSCAAAIDGAEIDVLVLAAAAGDIAAQAGACLLYTSDAADDTQFV